MKKKGFTLVEQLAVIVILSVIAIITVPIIGNVIEESRKKALEQSAYGLVEAADYYALEHEGEYSFLFDNNHKGENIDKTRQLDYKGSIEGEGKLYINNNGDISLCINNDKYYVYKSYDSGIVIGNISDNGECNVKKIGNHYVAYLENEGVGNYITNLDLYALKTDLNDYATKDELNGLSSIVSNVNIRYNTSTDTIQLYNSESKSWTDWKNGLSVANPLVPVLTSNSGSDGGYVLVSSEKDGNNGFKSFDNVSNTAWLPTSGEKNSYIGYHFPTTKKVTKLVIVPILSANVLISTPFYLQGSNDDINWVDIISGEVYYNNLYSVEFPNNNSYYAYRIYFPETIYLAGSHILASAKIQFYGN